MKLEILARVSEPNVLLKVFPKEGSVLSVIETSDHLFRWSWLDPDTHALPHNLDAQLAHLSRIVSHIIHPESFPRKMNSIKYSASLLPRKQSFFNFRISGIVY